jgi:anti-sigma B factor antagonist
MLVFISPTVTRGMCEGRHMEFGVSSEIVSGALVVSVRGDVDLATAGRMDSEILMAWQPPQPLVVDASAVPFMDSTGLGVLIKAAERASNLGGSVAIVTSADRVRKVFSITGLDSFIFVAESLDEALRATKLT